MIYADIITKYIEMEAFVSNNCVDIKNIEDFEVIESNDIVYYGLRTAKNIEGNCFLKVINGVFYIYTYNSIYGIYKSILDYKGANAHNIYCALEYYYLLDLNKLYENKNSTFIKLDDFRKYLLSEYNFVNEEDFYRNRNDESNYKIIYDIITKIENIKNEYKLDKDQSIILYNILKYDLNKSINIHKLYNDCIFGKEDNNLEVSVSKEFYKTINNIKLFEEIIMKVLEKTNIRIDFDYNENYPGRERF